MESKFKDITFTHENDFDEWLDKMTKYEIYLEPHQDATKFYVHESGEILHSNFQAFIWNGAFIKEPGNLKENDSIYMWHPLDSNADENNFSKMMFIVRKIIKK